MKLRKCEYCKCETNALLRRCCNKGTQDDIKSAFERDMEERMQSEEFAQEYNLSKEQIWEADWKIECLKWQGKVLTGDKCHYCHSWDGLPIDETCDEFECCQCIFTT